MPEPIPPPPLPPPRASLGTTVALVVLGLLIVIPAGLCSGLTIFAGFSEFWNDTAALGPQRFGILATMMFPLGLSIAFLVAGVLLIRHAVRRRRGQQ